MGQYFYRYIPTLKTEYVIKLNEIKIQSVLNHKKVIQHKKL